MDRKLTGGTRRALGAIAALGLAWPSAVGAQAVCSAPHSSPVLAGGGRIGTLAPGAGWAQASVLAQRSSRFFAPDGNRQPFLADGQVRTVSLYLTAAVGVVRGLDVWGQVPLHDVVYEDRGGRRGSSGRGDLRVSLRASPELVGARAMPLAVRAGVKLPGAEFPLDATIIPLTEGQRDWELSVETGRAFQSMPLYVLAWLGYRWREENQTAARKPGNERFAHVALGGRAFSLRWELATEYLQGDTPRHLAFHVPTARRRMSQLSPTVSRRAGPGEVELTAILPIAGRSLPTGAAGSVGYRWHWGDGAR